jgi:hypothetical protein
VHFFELNARVVWGLTASVLVETAEVAFGRKAAFRKNPPGEGGTDIQSIRATPGDLEDDAAKEAPRPRESKKKNRGDVASRL